MDDQADGTPSTEFDYDDINAVVEDVKLFHDTLDPRDRDYHDVEGLIAYYLDELDSVEGITFEYGKKAALVYLYRERYGEVE